MFQKMFLALFFSAAVFSCRGATILVPVNIRIVDGNITLAPIGDGLLNDVFWKHNPFWKFENYNDNITFFYGRHDKYRGLVLLNRKAVKKDTAWALVSRPLKLDPKKDEFSLAVDLATNVLIDRSCSRQPLYQTKLVWYGPGREEKPILEQPFALKALPDRPYVNLITGRIPAGAEKVVIRIGADYPDLEPGQFLVFRRIVFRQYSSRNPVYPKEGGFISHPIDVRDKNFSWKHGFSWTGRLPGKSQFGIRFAWARDEHGIPGPWSPFLGPDGNARTFFNVPGKLPKIPAGAAWVRYQFVLIPDRHAAELPLLTSVSVGGVTDAGWLGVKDYSPPEILRVSDSPESSGTKPLVLSIRDDMPIRWETLKVTVDGGAAAVRMTRTGGIVTLHPLLPFSPGLHSCRVTVSDFEKNHTEKKLWFFIGPVPSSDRISLRDDGILLIDGKPFFPIGIYAVCKREFNQNSFDKAFQELQKGGFNTAHTYNTKRDGDFREFMAAARKYGFRVFLSGPGGANSKDLHRLLETVASERMESSLLSWYLADDTYRHNTPVQLAELNTAVKAVDPWHPTSQAEHARGRQEPGLPLRSWYAGYVNGTDIFLPEIYPVRAKTEEDYRHGVPTALGDMKSIAADMAEAGPVRKGCWPIIQYFEGWNYNRFPSCVEMRAMVYLSIIHGATGITWYTYGGFSDPKTKKNNFGVTSTPERWQNVCRTASELKKLTPWLVARKGVQPPLPRILSGPLKDEEGNPSVSLLLKTADGVSCLMTASSSWQPLKAAFPLKGFTRAEVLFENRTVTLKDGVLTDDFKPYAVHIYRLY